MKQNSGFNPMGSVFVKPPKGTDLREEHREMMTADHLNANLYGEEADAQGGEKIDPVTGRPMKNKRAHEDDPGFNESKRGRRWR